LPSGRCRRNPAGARRTPSPRGSGSTRARARSPGWLHPASTVAPRAPRILRHAAGRSPTPPREPHGAPTDRPCAPDKRGRARARRVGARRKSRLICRMQTRVQGPGLPKTLLAYHFIAGREITEAGAELVRRNPANQKDVVTVAPEGSAADVKRACEAARAAQARWGRVPAPERAQVLGQLARLLLESKESLARFVAREVGKPVREARGGVQSAIDTAEFVQSEGRRRCGQTVPIELPNKELSS